MKRRTILFAAILWSGLQFLPGCGNNGNRKEAARDQNQAEKYLEVKGIIYDFGRVQKDVDALQASLKQRTDALQEFGVALAAKADIAGKRLKLDAANKQLNREVQKFYDTTSKYMLVGRVLRALPDGLIVAVPELKPSFYSRQTVFLSGYEGQNKANEGRDLDKPVFGIQMGTYSLAGHGMTNIIPRFEAGKQPAKPFKERDARPLPE